MRLLKFERTGHATYLNPLHITHVSCVYDGNGKSHVEVGVVNDGGNHYMTQSMDEADAARVQREIADGFAKAMNGCFACPRAGRDLRKEDEDEDEVEDEDEPNIVGN